MNVASITGSASRSGDHHKYIIGGIKISVPLLDYTISVQLTPDEWKRWYLVSGTPGGKVAQQKFKELVHKKDVQLSTYGGGTFTFYVPASKERATPEVAGNYTLIVVREAFADAGL